MKILIRFFLVVLTGSCCLGAAAQKWQEAQVKTLKGKIVPFGSLTQKDSVVLVCFWSTESEASINELNAINSSYEHWKELANFRLVAVSVDEGKLANKVRPLVNMNGWTFDVCTDINGELRKALASNNLPQSMIIQQGKLIYEQSGYEPGTEDYLLNRIRSLRLEKK